MKRERIKLWRERKRERERERERKWMENSGRRREKESIIYCANIHLES